MLYKEVSSVQITTVFKEFILTVNALYSLFSKELVALTNCFTHTGEEYFPLIYFRDGEEFGLAHSKQACVA